MTGLREYILHQIREMKREMLVAIGGLTQEELSSHEPLGRSPIAWIVEHCSGNADFFIHAGATGKPCADHEHRFTAWPIIDPRPGESYPSSAEIQARWTKVLDARADAVAKLREAELQSPSKSFNGEPLVESCLRVINHTNAHLRQIWCIIGSRHVKDRYPQQETWLA